MRTALIFNERSGATQEMSAAEFERAYAGNSRMGIQAFDPEMLPYLRATCPTEDVAVHFRKSYVRMGGREQVRACWVRPNGYGDQDHVLMNDPPDTSNQLEQAIKEGQSVVLNLNMNFSLKPLSFRHMEEEYAFSLRNWARHHKGDYITAPVKSARDALKLIKQIHEIAPDRTMSDFVFASHQGVIMPYGNFYLGDNRIRSQNIHDDLQNGKGGAPLGKTRMIGFPRLFCFMPTVTTMTAAKPNGIKGNYLKQPSGKPFVSQLVFSKQKDGYLVDPSYKNLAKERVVYVLASPSVKRSNNSDDWKMLRWAILDDSQIAPLDQDKLNELRLSDRELMVLLQKSEERCAQEQPSDSPTFS